MRYLGVDYGSKRTGLALSDEGGRVAFPHAVIEGDSIGAIRTLVGTCNIGTIVLGDPKNIKGGENPVRADVLAFKKRLEGALDVPVALFDETLTTSEAKRAGLPPPHDARAATRILQHYLDTRREKE